MSAPLDFLKSFAGKLRETGIRFALTSGMACAARATINCSTWPAGSCPVNNR